MRVALLATGDDQHCGIATYTSSLEAGLNVDTERIPLKLRSMDLLHYLRAGWRAGRTDADILHVQHEYGIYGPKSVASWFLFGTLWLASLFRDLPVVVTFHSAWNKETIDPPLYSVKSLYVTLNNRMLAAVADHALFLSESTRGAFEESAPLASSEVIAHGVQTDVHPIPEGEAKAEFGYDVDETLIVEPGFVRPQKGYETFLAIAAELPQTAFLIGGGPQDEEDEPYAAELRERAPDNVAMTGVLDDDRFHALFNAADVAVLPYVVVTQSGIVNWCIAYEVPIVATDLDRFESLHDKYDFPLVFPNGDVNAGADAVREALADSTSIVEGMQHYRDDRGMDAVADEHTRLYERLAKD